MAWTLLRAGLRDPSPPPAPEPEVDPKVEPDVEPGHAVAPQPGTEAWILAGGLVRTLEQAGLVAQLLDSAPPPRVVYGWGLSTCNAVLACTGDARSVRRGWEELRAQRFVAAAALRRLPWLTSLACDRRIGPALHAQLGNAQPGPQLLLHVEGRFLPVGDGTLASVLNAATRADSRRPETLAAALAAAANEGVDRILVLGRHEREASAEDLGAQLAAVRSAGVEVCFLPPVSDGGDAPFLELLLPGSGRVERLFEAGRRAALRWIDSRHAAATA